MIAVWFDPSRKRRSLSICGLQMTRAPRAGVLAIRPAKPRRVDEVSTTTTTEGMKSVSADDTTSEWLKGALQGALQRDPVDALNDALVLADLLEERLRLLSTSDLHIMEDAVMASEIEQLPDLHGYLKLASLSDGQRVKISLG